MKATVFDFDGVIVLDSESFKEEAWALVFAPYPEEVWRARFRESKELFGYGKRGDRYDVIRHVLAGVDPDGTQDAGLIEAIATAFDEHLQQRIREAGPASGCVPLLEDLSARMPLFINSGTSEHGLRRSVEALRLSQYFTGVYGTPASKVENFVTIGAAAAALPQEILFVGDGDGDVRAAEAFGTQFLGIANPYNNWTPETVSFPLVTALPEVRLYAL